jgi:subtilisin
MKEKAKMKKTAISILLISVICLNLLVIGNAAAQPTEKTPVIITFKTTPDAAIVKTFNGDIKYTYTIIPAIAASLPPQAIEALQRNPNIETIEPDAKAYATEDVYQWGINQIGANIVHQSGNTGQGVKVAIIDTGIDNTHPDLNDNCIGGYDFVNNDNFPSDDNGHGTHCAGIVAAEDDGEGIIGVAPNAELYAIKVLNAQGSGYYSDIVAGIQWAVNNGAQIISMSLGGNTGSTSLQAACDNAQSAGVLVVAAAGNDYYKFRVREYDTVDYPARYASVIAVGATDSNNIRAYFSSTGPAVELAAPGLNIYSTVPGGYATYSGTSMATPHVAGVAALVFNTPVDPNFDANKNEKWEGNEVRAKLQATADDLGTAGRDNWYGFGIVDTDEAAAPANPLPNQSPVANAGEDQALTADPSGNVQVNFDGSASYDPDGEIIQYTWMEGINTLSQEVSFSQVFAVGTYEITLTVTDNDGATSSDQVLVKVDPYQQPPSTNKIHVASIKLSPESRAGGKQGYVIATITVVDQNEQPTAGVTVNGHWEGATNNYDVSITDVNGQASLVSNNVKNPQGHIFTFVLDSLAKTDYEYDSASNVETTKSITFPYLPLS